MADYKEKTVTGQQWQRAWKVECSNHINAPKKITYYEETAVYLGERVLNSPLSKLLVKTLDEETGGDTFPLLAPISGGVESLSEADLYTILSSHYYFVASQRDAKESSPLAP